MVTSATNTDVATPAWSANVLLFGSMSRDEAAEGRGLLHTLLRLDDIEAIGLTALCAELRKLMI